MATSASDWLRNEMHTILPPWAPCFKYWLHSLVLNILSTIMNSLCAKFYIIKSSNINTANIILFLAILHRISLFYPKIAISISIQLAIIGYVLNKIMNYHCVNFYTIASRNTNITNIFQCLAIFAQILTILPNNITFLTNSALHHWYFLLYMFMNYPCAKVYTTSSSNIKNTNIFQFLVILHRIWLFYHGMVLFSVSYLIIGRSFFHKFKIKSMNLHVNLQRL